MEKNHRYAVIMAGGIGSRFWPVSKTSRPKQFLDILGTGKSFIRHTFERFSKVIPAENFLVVTNTRYRPMVLEHLPELREEQVLCEPLSRNTAPCVAYAARHIHAIDPAATMVVTPSDHLILNENEFSEVITEGLGFAESHDALVTIGIQPGRPDTGYGYIQIDTGKKDGSFCKVKTFTEKPTLDVAKMFVESGEFFWNAGIFIWRTEKILREFEKYLPEVAQIFASIAGAYNTPDEQAAIDHIYPECRNVSIDYGIMEKSADTYVRCSDFGWSDIGTWGSLYTHRPKDVDDNAITGEAIAYDTRGCLISIPEGKVGVVKGLEEYIVVASEDSLLICPRSEEQCIRQFVEDVKLKKGDEYV
ncbi:MAG: mannose-1-phosphate guanylyltransferase [Rikenellaceae bacterium]|jgi:mannose-1-phosphate guanylyltransferase|nr:mannose-1-phosphate guanylyltransferase [Rikenellaceae bacterium]